MCGGSEEGGSRHVITTTNQRSFIVSKPTFWPAKNTWKLEIVMHVLFKQLDICFILVTRFNPTTSEWTMMVNDSGRVVVFYHFRRYLTWNEPIKAIQPWP
jgi:hypothetical protein